MSGRPWTDAELKTLDTLSGRFAPRVMATSLPGRTPKAISIMKSRRKREHQRVDAARAARSNSRETEVRV